MDTKSVDFYSLFPKHIGSAITRYGDAFYAFGIGNTKRSIEILEMVSLAIEDANKELKECIKYLRSKSK